MNKLFLSLALAAGALLSLPGCCGKKKEKAAAPKKEMKSEKKDKGMKKEVPAKKAKPTAKKDDGMKKAGYKKADGKM